MKTLVWVSFHFESGHALPEMGRAKYHGHTYDARVWFPADGTSVERLRDRCEPARLALDHQNLNEVMPEPTMENIGVWFLDNITSALKIEIWRRDCGCEVTR